MRYQLEMVFVLPRLNVPLPTLHANVKYIIGQAKMQFHQFQFAISLPSLDSEKFVKMSTNKPSIGAVVLEIAPWIFENSFKFQLFLTQICSQHSFQLISTRVANYQRQLSLLSGLKSVANYFRATGEGQKLYLKKW